MRASQYKQRNIDLFQLLIIQSQKSEMPWMEVRYTLSTLALNPNLLRSLLLVHQ